jgi:hypothetical protein
MYDLIYIGTEFNPIYIKCKKTYFISALSLILFIHIECMTLFISAQSLILSTLEPLQIDEITISSFDSKDSSDHI